MKAAPATVIVASDPLFYEQLPTLFPAAAGARDNYAAKPAWAAETAFRNSSLQGAYFILAARAMGATELRILARELLPNVILPLLAFFLLGVAVIIVLEGALSFLGLGVPPPAPSWGGMIGEGRESLEMAPRIALLPALCMFLTVLSFNVVGDTLRAHTDPRQGAA